MPMQDGEGRQVALPLLFIVLLCLAAFAPGLGTLSLMDTDEPRFAESARQMLLTGDYIVPYFNGEPRYHKPPMVYWVMVQGYRVFGVNEVGARAGSLVLNAAGIIGLYFIARSMYGNRAALFTGVIAPTALLFLLQGRVATADATLFATIVLMFGGFWRIASGRRNIISYLMMYGGLAAGGLTKGPVSPAVLIVAMLLYAMFRRSYPSGSTFGQRLGLWWSELRQVMKETRFLPGFAAATAVAMAWFIPAIILTDGGFLRVGFGGHVLERSFGRSYEGHRGIPIVFYLVILPATLFPWFSILPESLRRLWQTDANGNRRAFLLAWGIAPFIVFSFLKTKLFHYTMPAYPAFAIACGAALAGVIGGGTTFWKTRLGKLGMIIFAVSSVAFAIGIVGFAVFYKIDDDLHWWAVPGIVMIGCMIFGLRAFVRGRNERGAAWLAGLSLASFTMLFLTVAPAIESHYSYRNLAEAIKKHVEPGVPVVSVGKTLPSLIFYLQQRVHEEMPPDGDFDELWRDDKNFSAGKMIVVASEKRRWTAANREQIKDIERCFNTSKMRWDAVTVWIVRREPQTDKEAEPRMNANEPE